MRNVKTRIMRKRENVNYWEKKMRKGESRRVHEKGSSYIQRERIEWGEAKRKKKEKKERDIPVLTLICGNCHSCWL